MAIITPLATIMCYITPNGKFGVLDFDLLGNESFTELESFLEYKHGP